MTIDQWVPSKPTQKAVRDNPGRPFATLPLSILLQTNIDGVVKALHLLRCCKFHYHYDVPSYAEIIIKFTRLEYEAFYLTIQELWMFFLRDYQYLLSENTISRWISALRRKQEQNWVEFSGQHLVLHRQVQKG